MTTRREPTKADLAAAVATLTAENAGLRDLLAAVSAGADTVPVSKGSNYGGEWQRSTRVLCNITQTADPGGCWAWGHTNGAAAEHLRKIAAEPVGYEVCTEAEAEAEASVPAGEGGVLIGPFDDDDESGPMDDEAELRRADEVAEVSA